MDKKIKKTKSKSKPKVMNMEEMGNRFCTNYWCKYNDEPLENPFMDTCPLCGHPTVWEKDIW